MDSTDLMDDEEQDHLLTRSNSWSHTQRPSFMANTPRPTRPSNGLSCIYEGDDTTGTVQETDFTTDNTRNRSKSMSTGTGAQSQVKKRRHSYTELIASAILSSSEKRKTLAEIYDWFVLNVPSFKDQRYMHSSLGWKNAVRHNLSVQTCFKRVKRHGMEKPSWWTVDMSEVSKRRLVLRPTLTNTNGNGNGDGDTDSGVFLPPRRNTYSGPVPNQQQSSVNNETNGGHKMAYRVASSSDVHADSAPYRRSHYTPIRPAVTPSRGNEMPVFTVGYQNSGSSDLIYGDATGFNNNDDSVFLKPCALDTQSKIQSHINPGMVPSVTLVCKGSPTSSHPYHHAQLEVSFQSNESGHNTLSPVSPSGYNWASSSTSPCSQTSPTSNMVHPLNHFNTWPNIADSVNMEQAGPNQTLRIKTAWGNVEDIQFDGLLPIRTVVKCDSMTQTEEKNGSPKVNKAVVNKNFARTQWGHDSNKYHQSNNIADHSWTLPADLPEDLAGLQIEGDLHCDIDEVMGASMESSRPMWTGGWYSAFDQMEDSSCLNVTHSSAKMGMSDSEI